MFAFILLLAHPLTEKHINAMVASVTLFAFMLNFSYSFVLNSSLSTEAFCSVDRMPNDPILIQATHDLSKNNALLLLVAPKMGLFVSE